MAGANRRGETQLSIDPTQPFEFEHSRAFLRGFAPCSGSHRCSIRTLTTGGYADGTPFVGRISQGDPGTLLVDVEWLAEPGPIADVDAWVRAFLSLDDDLTPLYEAAEDDPAFERVVEIDGGELLLFPTPEMVRDAEPAVREAIDNDRKEKTLLAAAEAFAEENLSALDDRQLRERLAEIWGFGDWSSEFIALRGFGRLSSLPRTERRLRETVATLYGLDTEEASDAALDRLSDPYVPLEGYWAHYIRVWEFIDSPGG